MPLPSAALPASRLHAYHGAAGSYSLPADHAARPTRAAGMKNLATGMQYIGLMALVEDQIVDCFRRARAEPGRHIPRRPALAPEPVTARQRSRSALALIVPLSAAPCRNESRDRAGTNRSPESFVNGLVFTLKG